MSPVDLVFPMTAHVIWLTVLYVALTIARAPTAWGLGRRPDGANPWAVVEKRVSANLRNQFEWPMLFYVACLLLIIQPGPIEPITVWLAWAFVVGRILHSGVQIVSENVRLRGVVFTINFAAVLGMWFSVVAGYLRT